MSLVSAAKDQVQSDFVFLSQINKHACMQSKIKTAVVEDINDNKIYIK